MVLCQSWLREANFRGENCGCTPGVFVIVHLAHLHLARERITRRHVIVTRRGQDCIDEGTVAVYDDARRLTRARPSDLDDNAWTSGVGTIRNLDLRISNALRGWASPGSILGRGSCAVSECAAMNIPHGRPRNMAGAISCFHYTSGTQLVNERFNF